MAQFDENGMIDREALSSLNGKRIASVQMEGCNVQFLDDAGRVMFSCGYADLFDKDGNHFRYC